MPGWTYPPLAVNPRHEVPVWHNVRRARRRRLRQSTCGAESFVTEIELLAAAETQKVAPSGWSISASTSCILGALKPGPSHCRGLQPARRSSDAAMQHHPAEQRDRGSRADSKPARDRHAVLLWW